MRYRVSAIPRENFSGFWRSGRFFPNAPSFVELEEEEMTDAIRQEPMLIIQPIPEQAQPEPAQPTDEAPAAKRPGPKKPKT